MSKDRIKNKQKVLQAVLGDIAEGRSASVACQNNNISRDTFFRAIKNDAEFEKAYCYAKELCYDKFADDIIDISDNQKENNNRSRLRVDSRKWLLSKLLPKKYGEKIEIENKGQPIADASAAALASFLEKIKSGGQDNA